MSILSILDKLEDLAKNFALNECHKRKNALYDEFHQIVKDFISNDKFPFKAKLQSMGSALYVYSKIRSSNFSKTMTSADPLIKYLFIQSAGLILSHRMSEMEKNDASLILFKTMLTSCEKLLSSHQESHFFTHLLKLIENRWSHPTLLAILSKNEIEEETALKYLNEMEHPEVLRWRLDTLISCNLTQLATNLLSWITVSVKLSKDISFAALHLILLCKAGDINGFYKMCIRMQEDNISYQVLCHMMSSYVNIDCTRNTAVLMAARTFLILDWIKGSQTAHSEALLRKWMTLERDCARGEWFVASVEKLLAVHPNAAQIVTLLRITGELFGDRFVDYCSKIVLSVIQRERHKFNCHHFYAKNRVEAETHSRTLASICEVMSRMFQDDYVHMKQSCLLSAAYIYPCNENYFAVEKFFKDQQETEIQSDPVTPPSLVDQKTFDNLLEAVDMLRDERFDVQRDWDTLSMLFRFRYRQKGLRYDQNLKLFESNHENLETNKADENVVVLENIIESRSHRRKSKFKRGSRVFYSSDSNSSDFSRLKLRPRSEPRLKHILESNDSGDSNATEDYGPRDEMQRGMVGICIKTGGATNENGDDLKADEDREQKETTRIESENPVTKKLISSRGSQDFNIFEHLESMVATGIIAESGEQQESGMLGLEGATDVSKSCRLGLEGAADVSSKSCMLGLEPASDMSKNCMPGLESVADGLKNSILGLESPEKRSKICMLGLEDAADISKNFSSLPASEPDNLITKEICETSLLDKDAGNTVEQQEMKVEEMVKTTDEVAPRESNKNKIEFPCRYCGKVLTSRMGQKIHNTRIHPDMKEANLEYECLDCRMKFSNMTQFFVHLRSRHRSRLGDIGDASNFSVDNISQLVTKIGRLGAGMVDSEMPESCSGECKRMSPGDKCKCGQAENYSCPDTGQENKGNKAVVKECTVRLTRLCLAKVKLRECRVSIEYLAPALLRSLITKIDQSISLSPVKMGLVLKHCNRSIAHKLSSESSSSLDGGNGLSAKTENLKIKDSFRVTNIKDLKMSLKNLKSDLMSRVMKRQIGSSERVDWFKKNRLMVTRDKNTKVWQARACRNIFSDLEKTPPRNGLLPLIAAGNKMHFESQSFRRSIRLGAKILARRNNAMKCRRQQFLLKRQNGFSFKHRFDRKPQNGLQYKLRMHSAVSFKSLKSSGDDSVNSETDVEIESADEKISEPKADRKNVSAISTSSDSSRPFISKVSVLCKRLPEVISKIGDKVKISKDGQIPVFIKHRGISVRRIAEYCCEVCLKRSNVEEDIIIHIRNVHGLKEQASLFTVYACVACNFRDSRIDAVYYHTVNSCCYKAQSSEAEDKDDKDDPTYTDATNDRDLKSKMDFRFGCITCKIFYVTKALLNRHYREMHSLIYKEALEMRYIRKSSDGVEEIVFPENASAVDVSARIPKSSVKFGCSHCHSLYNVKRNLNQHMKYVHGMSAEDIANMSLSEESTASKELFIPNLELVAVRFGCSECGASYSCKRNLNQHMKYSHQMTPFEIAEMGLSRTSTASLMVYTPKSGADSNVGIPPDGTTDPEKCAKWVASANAIKFGCSACRTLYNGKLNINQHMRCTHKMTHLDIITMSISDLSTGDCLFYVPKCAEDNLKSELPTDELNDLTKRFGCAACQTTYVHRQNLLQHFRSHHGVYHLELRRGNLLAEMSNGILLYKLKLREGGSSVALEKPDVDSKCELSSVTLEKPDVDSKCELSSVKLEKPDVDSKCELSSITLEKPDVDSKSELSSVTLEKPDFDSKSELSSVTVEKHVVSNCQLSSVTLEKHVDSKSELSSDAVEKPDVDSKCRLSPVAVEKHIDSGGSISGTSGTDLKPEQSLQKNEKIGGFGCSECNTTFSVRILLYYHMKKVHKLSTHDLVKLPQVEVTSDNIKMFEPRKQRSLPGQKMEGLLKKANNEKICGNRNNMLSESSMNEAGFQKIPLPVAAYNLAFARNSECSTETKEPEFFPKKSCELKRMSLVGESVQNLEPHNRDKDSKYSNELSKPRPSFRKRVLFTEGKTNRMLFPVPVKERSSQVSAKKIRLSAHKTKTSSSSSSSSTFKFICDVCGKTCSYKRSLIQHLENIHKFPHKIATEMANLKVTQLKSLENKSTDLFSPNAPNIKSEISETESGECTVIKSEKIPNQVASERILADINEQIFAGSKDMDLLDGSEHEEVIKIETPDQTILGEAYEPGARFGCAECKVLFLHRKGLNYHMKKSHIMSNKEAHEMAVSKKLSTPKVFYFIPKTGFSDDDTSNDSEASGSNEAPSVSVLDRGVQQDSMLDRAQKNSEQGDARASPEINNVSSRPNLASSGKQTNTPTRRAFNSKRRLLKIVLQPRLVQRGITFGCLFCKNSCTSWGSLVQHMDTFHGMLQKDVLSTFSEELSTKTKFVFNPSIRSSARRIKHSSSRNVPDFVSMKSEFESSEKSTAEIDRVSLDGSNSLDSLDSSRSGISAFVGDSLLTKKPSDEISHNRLRKGKERRTPWFGSTASGSLSTTSLLHFQDLNRSKISRYFKIKLSKVMKMRNRSCDLMSVKLSCSVCMNSICYWRSLVKHMQTKHGIQAGDMVKAFSEELSSKVLFVFDPGFHSTGKPTGDTESFPTPDDQLDRMSISEEASSGGSWSETDSSSEESAVEGGSCKTESSRSTECKEGRSLSSGNASPGGKSPVRLSELLDKVSEQFRTKLLKLITTRCKESEVKLCCSVCQNSIVYWRSFTRHMMEKHTIPLDRVLSTFSEELSSENLLVFVPPGCRNEEKNVKFCCSACNELFNSKNKLKEHFKDSHGISSRIDCSFSKRLSTSGVKVFIPVDRNSGTELECPICQASYFMRDAMFKHMQKSHAMTINEIRLSLSNKKSPNLSVALTPRREILEAEDKFLDKTDHLGENESVDTVNSDSRHLNQKIKHENVPEEILSKTDSSADEIEDFFSNPNAMQEKRFTEDWSEDCTKLYLLQNQKITETTKFRCSFCKISMNLRIELFKHMKNVHSLSLKDIILCFSREISTNHLHVFVPQPVPCHICRHPHTDRGSLVKHLGEVHEMAQEEIEQTISGNTLVNKLKNDIRKSDISGSDENQFEKSCPEKQTDDTSVQGVDDLVRCNPEKTSEETREDRTGENSSTLASNRLESNVPCNGTPENIKKAISRLSFYNNSIKKALKKDCRLITSSNLSPPAARTDIKASTSKSENEKSTNCLKPVVADLPNSEWYAKSLQVLLDDESVEEANIDQEFPKEMPQLSPQNYGRKLMNLLAEDEIDATSENCHDARSANFYAVDPTKSADISPPQLSLVQNIFKARTTVLPNPHSAIVFDNAASSDPSPVHTRSSPMIDAVEDSKDDNRSEMGFHTNSETNSDGRFYFTQSIGICNELQCNSDRSTSAELQPGTEQIGKSETTIIRSMDHRSWIDECSKESDNVEEAMESCQDQIVEFNNQSFEIKVNSPTLAEFLTKASIEMEVNSDANSFLDVSAEKTNWSSEFSPTVNLHSEDGNSEEILPVTMGRNPPIDLLTQDGIFEAVNSEYELNLQNLSSFVEIKEESSINVEPKSPQVNSQVEIVEIFDPSLEIKSPKEWLPQNDTSDVGCGSNLLVNLSCHGDMDKKSNIDIVMNSPVNSTSLDENIERASTNFERNSPVTLPTHEEIVIEADIYLNANSLVGLQSRNEVVEKSNFLHGNLPLPRELELNNSINFESKSPEHLSSAEELEEGINRNFDSSVSENDSMENVNYEPVLSPHDVTVREVNIDSERTVDTFDQSSHLTEAVVGSLEQDEIPVKKAYIQFEAPVNSPCQEEAKVGIKAPVNSRCQEEAKDKFEASVNSPCQVEANIEIEAPVNMTCQEEANTEFEASVNSLCQEEANIVIEAPVNSPCQEEANTEFEAPVNSPCQEEANTEFEAPVNSPCQKEANIVIEAPVNSPCQKEANIVIEAPVNSPCQEEANIEFEAPVNSPCQIEANIEIEAPVNSPCQEEANIEFKAPVNSPCQIEANIEIEAPVNSPCQEEANIEIEAPVNSPCQIEVNIEIEAPVNSTCQEEANIEFEAPVNSPCQIEAKIQFEAPVNSPCQEESNIEFEAPVNSPCQEEANIEIKAPVNSLCQEEANIEIEAPVNSTRQEEANIELEAPVNSPCRIEAKIQFEAPVNSPCQEESNIEFEAPVNSPCQEKANIEIKAPVNSPCQEEAKIEFEAPVNSPCQVEANIEFEAPVNSPCHNEANIEIEAPVNSPCPEEAKIEFEAPVNSPCQVEANIEFEAPVNSPCQVEANIEFEAPVNSPCQEEANIEFEAPVNSPCQEEANIQFEAPVNSPCQEKANIEFEAPVNSPCPEEANIEFEAPVNSPCPEEANTPKTSFELLSYGEIRNVEIPLKTEKRGPSVPSDEVTTGSNCERSSLFGRDEVNEAISSDTNAAVDLYSLEKFVEVASVEIQNIKTSSEGVTVDPSWTQIKDLETKIKLQTVIDHGLDSVPPDLTGTSADVTDMIEDPINLKEISSNLMEVSPDFTEAPPNSREVSSKFTEAPPNSREVSSKFTEAPLNSREVSPDFTEAPLNSREVSSDFTEAPLNSREVSPDFTEAPLNSREVSPDFTEAPLNSRGVSPDFTEAPLNSREVSPDFTEVPFGSKEDFPGFTKVPLNSSEVLPSLVDITFDSTMSSPDSRLVSPNSEVSSGSMETSRGSVFLDLRDSIQISTTCNSSHVNSSFPFSGNQLQSSNKSSLSSKLADMSKRFCSVTWKRSSITKKRSLDSNISENDSKRKEQLDVSKHASDISILPWVCCHCGVGFESHMVLISHLNSVHSNSPSASKLRRIESTNEPSHGHDRLSTSSTGQGYSTVMPGSSMDSSISIPVSSMDISKTCKVFSSDTFTTCQGSLKDTSTTANQVTSSVIQAACQATSNDTSTTCQATLSDTSITSNCRSANPAE